MFSPLLPLQVLSLVLVLLVSLVFLVGKDSSLPAQSTLVFMSNDASRLNNLKTYQIKRQGDKEAKIRDKETKRQRD